MISFKGNFSPEVMSIRGSFKSAISEVDFCLADT